VLSFQNSLTFLIYSKPYEVVISTDPGRFICNWIYYQSLHFSQLNETKSLFIHVPDFSVIPFETQLAFIKELLATIVDCLQ